VGTMKVPILPPIKPVKRAQEPAPTYPYFACLHCYAIEGKIEVVASISTFMGTFAGNMCTHRMEWESVPNDNPISLARRPTPFLVRLPRPTTRADIPGDTVVCMVVPPVPFDVVCAACVFNHGKANAIKSTMFCQTCCGKASSCRPLWKGDSLSADSTEITDLEWLTAPPHFPPGNPPVDLQVPINAVDAAKEAAAIAAEALESLREALVNKKKENLQETSTCNCTCCTCTNASVGTHQTRQTDDRHSLKSDKPLQLRP
jgi:hypothetical protein